MKTKRLPIIIGGICVLIIAGLIYFFRETDENKISRVVSIDSYESSLMNEIHERTGKLFDRLTESEKIQVLSNLSHLGTEHHRCAAVRKLISYAGISIADAAIIHGLNDSSSAVVEEAVHAIREKNIQSGGEALRNKIRQLSESHDASLPTGDISYAVLTGRTNHGDILFDYREYPGRLAPLDDSLVSEINLLLPQGGYYYCSFPNFDNNWRAFTRSTFMKRFAEQPAYHDLNGIAALQDFFHFKKIAEEKLGGLSKYFTPEKLFRDDLKFARYPEGKLLVTFSGKNIEIATALLSALQTFGKGKYNYSEHDVNGVRVVNIIIRPGRVLCFAHVGEYFVLSDSPALLDKSIQTYQSAREMSITALPSFQQSYKKLDLTGAKNFVCIFCEPSSALGLKGENRHSRYLIKIALDALGALQGKSVTLDDIVGKHPSMQSERFSALMKSIPSQVLSCDVISAMDVSLLWRYITQVRTVSAGALDSLESGTKVDMEKELISQFDAGGFISYSGIRYGADYESNLSAIQLVVGLTSANARTMSLPLSKVFQYLFRYPVIQEEYHGSVMYTTQNSDKDSDSRTEVRDEPTKVRDLPISPGFAIMDNVVLLGMNAQVLRDHIDAYVGRKQQLYSQENNVTPLEHKFIFRTTTLLKDFYSFLRRYSRRTTQFTATEIEDRVKPLFSLLEMNLSVHGWIKEFHTISHGQLTLDMK